MSALGGLEPILAFDATGDACSAAILSDGGAVSRLELMARGHSERLTPLLAALLAEAGLSWSDIRLFGAAVGPGSFTGVRVTVATARGLALATGRPALGAPTDAALAAAFKTARPAATEGVTRLGRPPRRLWRRFDLSGRVPRVTAAGVETPPADAPVIGPAAEAGRVEGFERIDPAALARLILARAECDPAAFAAPVRARYLRPPDATPPSAPPLARRAPVSTAGPGRSA